MARFTLKRGGIHYPPAGKTTQRKSNVPHIARRRLRAAKAAMDSDVYDYEPTKDRRRNVTLALDEDELRGAAYDDDEDEDDGNEARMRRRPRLIGEGEEEEHIRSDEDEEIDSDAAFGESDEDTFAGSNFMKRKKGPHKSSKKARRSVRFEEVDLDENGHEGSDAAPQDHEDETEEEEGEGEDGEFFDVLDILDGRVEPESEEESNFSRSREGRASAARKSADLAVTESEVAEEDEDENEGGEEDEEDEEESANDEALISGSEAEEDPSALEALDNFVSGLEAGEKRKASDEEQDVQDHGVPGQVKKKKRLLRDRTESGIENEFTANAAGSSKLSLDDLLKPLAPKQGALSSLKKSMKPLTVSLNPKNQPLPAPLPTRTQDKLEREVAYEQTKQEVDKWTDTMKKIKEAEHLSFPLQTPRAVKISNLELTAKFRPTTEMESSIDRLLKSAKLHEDDINQTEDLMMKDLTVEEVTQRRAELRRMRELAFRADAKAKRVAKIKSKTYRRIRKRERTNLQAKIDAVEGQDEADLDEERLKAETERARERATLKHKNTGKWAKAMKARGELDGDQRRDINEMLERGESLRRRIQGTASGDENVSESGSSDEDEGEDGVLRIKTTAFDELKKVQEEGYEEVDDADSKPKATSVFQMKFMKDAAVRNNLALDREIGDFRREMGDLPGGSDDEEVDDDDMDVPPPVERINGRMVFRPGPQIQPSSLLPPPPPSAISETSTLKSHDSVAHSPTLTIRDDPLVTPPPKFTYSATVTSAEHANPWLVESSSSTKVAKRKNELLVGKNVTRAQKSEAMVQKQLKKGTEEREMERADAIVEIIPDKVLLPNNADKSKEKSAPAANGAASQGKKKKDRKKDRKDKEKKRAIQPGEDDSDANSEVEEQEAVLSKGRKQTVFEQRELVARAFAGDNVVREFAEDKQKEIETDAPREVDTTLAGWGSWGGAGVQKGAPKPHLIKKVAGIDPKSRADYGKAHVIISERRDKKALKFAVKDLPYPYTSKAQFEARMSTPLGVEWNTRLGFQRETLPRVVKKMGTVIDPLEKL